MTQGQFKCRRTSVETAPIPVHTLSAIDDAIPQIETAILEDRRVIEHQLVREVKISLGSLTICTWEKCLLDGFYGCSHLYRSRKGSSVLKLFRQSRQSGGLLC